jgi:hypothetical protein
MEEKNKQTLRNNYIVHVNNKTWLSSFWKKGPNGQIELMLLTEAAKLPIFKLPP